MKRSSTPIKSGSTLFLKAVLLLVGILVFIGLLWEPQLEGRNANSDPISLYFNDPFLAYLYLAFVPFFIALYQAFKLLEFIEKDAVFSEISVKALRNIKYCAITFIGFILGAVVWIKIMSGDDDPAGALAIGIVLIFASTVIATAAGVFQNLLQNAVDIKSENDLTV